MELDVNALEVTNNRGESRFEAQIGEEVAYMRYFMRADDLYVVIHTEVPEAYGGKGVAAKLAHDVLELIKAEGAKVVPQCPFLKVYLKRHKEYQELVG